ncbi:hypothetical protein V2J09_020066 [Rumex salicifolius]
MERPPCCDKANVKRGLWTPEEDAKILAYVASHGTGNWTLVPKKAGLNRCGKSCRLRWTNYLRPDLNHEDFSPQEEELIVELHKAIGSRWSLIAKRLPGRTDNDVKNYWNTKLKKKLMKMEIDPITHKPFSQIFSDYNNVSYMTNNHHQNSQNRSIVTRLSPSMMPILSHFQDPLIEIQSDSNPGIFDQVACPAAATSSSCSSSSSSLNNINALQTVVSGDQDHGIVQYDDFGGNAGDVNEGETSSFVKEILDRDDELQLDLLGLNEFLDY